MNYVVRFIFAAFKNSQGTRKKNEEGSPISENSFKRHSISVPKVLSASGKFKTFQLFNFSREETDA